MLQTPTTALSSQERKIISLIAEGYKSHYIADKLCISPHTVKNHKTNICQKLNLSNTTELLGYAILNAAMLQNEGGGKNYIGTFPIFGFLAQNRKSSYCLGFGFFSILACQEGLGIFQNNFLNF